MKAQLKSVVLSVLPREPLFRSCFAGNTRLAPPSGPYFHGPQSQYEDIRGADPTALEPHDWDHFGRHPTLAHFGSITKAAPNPSDTRILPDERDPSKRILRFWLGDPAFGSVAATDAGIAMTTLDKPKEAYHLQVQVRNQGLVKKGDTMLVRFAARSRRAEAATGATRLTVGFGKASPPWSLAFNSQLVPGKQWQRFDVPFTYPFDFGVNEAQLTFTFGYTPQEVEVADVSLLDFGDQTPTTALPRTKRFADKVAAEVAERELLRIRTLRAEMDSNRDPSPAHGRILHVAPISGTGRTEGLGTAEQPFVSISQALQLAAAGDTILVDAGEYREPNGIAVNKSGKPDAWIKIKAAPGARPKIITSGWSECASPQLRYHLQRPRRLRGSRALGTTLRDELARAALGRVDPLLCCDQTTPERIASLWLLKRPPPHAKVARGAREVQRCRVA